jgi:hypothetical protein
MTVPESPHALPGLPLVPAVAMGIGAMSVVMLNIRLTWHAGIVVGTAGTSIVAQHYLARETAPGCRGRSS